jgi:hypothetical protein
VEEGQRGAVEDVGDSEAALALMVGRRGRQRCGLAGLLELGGTAACSGQRAEEARELRATESVGAKWSGRITDLV